MGVRGCERATNESMAMTMVIVCIVKPLLLKQIHTHAYPRTQELQPPNLITLIFTLRVQYLTQRIVHPQMYIAMHTPDRTK